jgi:hypothetical protein
MASTAGDPSARPKPTNTGRSLRNVARKRSWAAAGLSVWRATRSRGGWPAGPVKLRRLTGPGAAGAGARSWAAAAQSWRDRRSCFGGRPKLAGGASHFWRNRRSFQKGWRVGGHGASPKCRRGMPQLEQDTKLTRNMKLPYKDHPTGVGLSSPSDQPLRRLQSLRGFSHVFRDLKTSALTIPLRGFAKPRNYPPPPMGLSSHLSELRKTDDQGLIDWCPPVMRDTHPKD